MRFVKYKAYDAIQGLPDSAAGIARARISGATPEQVQDWAAFMTSLFVDVKSAIAASVSTLLRPERGTS
jgi:hypothetical protein